MATNSHLGRGDRTAIVWAGVEQTAAVHLHRSEPSVSLNLKSQHKTARLVAAAASSRAGPIAELTLHKFA